MKKFIWIPLALAPMVGCTPYTTEFRCPIGQGMSCRSMSQVHDAVSSGVFSGHAIQGEKSGTQPQLYFPPQSSQKPSSPKSLVNAAARAS